jgi:hypothetical protein
MRGNNCTIMTVMLVNTRGSGGKSFVEAVGGRTEQGDAGRGRGKPFKRFRSRVPAGSTSLKRGVNEMGKAPMNLNGEEQRAGTRLPRHFGAQCGYLRPPVLQSERGRDGGTKEITPEEVVAILGGISQPQHAARSH